MDVTGTILVSIASAVTIACVVVPIGIDVLHRRALRKKPRRQKPQLQNVDIRTLDPKRGNRLMCVRWDTGRVEVYMQDAGPHYPKDSPFKWFGPDGHDLDWERGKEFIREWERSRDAKKFDEELEKLLINKDN